MVRKKINFAQLEDIVAMAMYLEFVNDGSAELFPEEVAKLLQNQFPINAVALLLEDLSRSNIPRSIYKFQKINDPTDPLDLAAPKYRLTKTGVQYIEDLPDDEYSTLKSIISSTTDSADTSIPASDRTVTLHDNQVEEATKRIEGFVQDFRQDHHFGNEWAAEKNVLIEALESGKAYIQHKVIEVRIATMVTIEPLKEVVAKYEQAAVGGTISAMAQELIKFLMELFKN